jgi:hypothetical protein
VSQQPGEGGDGHIAQSGTLLSEPLFEGGIADLEPIQKFALIERGGFLQLLGGSTADQALEGPDVGRDDLGLQGNTVAICYQGRGRFAEIVPERRQRLAQAGAGLGVDQRRSGSRLKPRQLLDATVELGIRRGPDRRRSGPRQNLESTF